MNNDLEIFLAVSPGLEALLCEELRELGFLGVRAGAGGVTIKGDWSDVWRANLCVRGASRVLVRIAQFRAQHLSQLDKRAHQIAWPDFIKPRTQIRVDVSCKSSKIYHSGAAAERIGKAACDRAKAELNRHSGLRVFARIENDLCTISLDTSGELLHKRGFKQAVGKAPLRETLAALFLRSCGYTGDEPVLDPMCGSGTLVIEAAEIAKGLAPGRCRKFAFENFANHDAPSWDTLREEMTPNNTHVDTLTEASDKLGFYGYDRNGPAIEMSTENAARAGVADSTHFAHQNINALTRPDGPAGLVLINPPYGARIGNHNQLTTLHRALGRILKEKFSGWRIGLITNKPNLAKATGLPFDQSSAPIPHGALRIKLYQTGALKSH